MSNENIQSSSIDLSLVNGGTVVSDSDVAGSECDTGSGSELNPTMGELVAAEIEASGKGDLAPDPLDPRLKPGVPVMDIGVSEEDAISLGLLKSEQDYKAEEAVKIAQLEAMNHSDMLDDATYNLVQSVRASLAAAINLGDVTNQVYGKFMHLGMASQSEALRNLNSNVHFNKMIELLEQVKAHSILLRVEMSDI